MKIAIVGSRDWKETRRVERHVEQIAKKYPDAVAFHANNSRGTADSIQHARKLSKPLFIYKPN